MTAVESSFATFGLICTLALSTHFSPLFKNLYAFPCRHARTSHRRFRVTFGPLPHNRTLLAALARLISAPAFVGLPANLTPANGFIFRITQATSMPFSSGRRCRWRFVNSPVLLQPRTTGREALFVVGLPLRCFMRCSLTALISRCIKVLST